MRVRPASGWALAALLVVPAARGHDIPNERVDRSIQVRLAPGRVEVDYEVSLSELTLAQDLRSLIGPLPAVDRAALFDRYGRETAPLNARGLLLEVDGEAMGLAARGFDLIVEEHPRYTFRFAAPLPGRGRLVLRDTNYAASEGTSRLALRVADGLDATGYDGPSRVEDVPVRPVWRLSDEEERRTKELAITFEAAGPAEGPARPPAVATPTKPMPDRPSRSLPGLLDRAPRLSTPALLVLAALIGAAHAVQPGHGKTLVAAATLTGRGTWARGVLLAAIVTAAHLSSVVAIAGALWASRTVRYGAIDAILTDLAGFAIAAVGLWRLGRHLGGYGGHGHQAEAVAPTGLRDLIAVGLAGGLVPCWDAVVLIVVAEAVGRLALGISLLVGFSLGMGAVLVAVGALAGRLGGILSTADEDGRWGRRVGLAGSAVLTAMGLYLLIR